MRSDSVNEHFLLDEEEKSALAHLVPRKPRRESRSPSFRLLNKRWVGFSPNVTSFVFSVVKRERTKPGGHKETQGKQRC